MGKGTILTAAIYGGFCLIRHQAGDFHDRNSESASPRRRFR
jgi:hypothetical protein